MRSIIGMLIVLTFTVPTLGIWQGREVSKGAWSSVVYFKLSEEACTGTFIHVRVLLTAGHCLENADIRSINRRGGTLNIKLADTRQSWLQKAEIERVVMHPKYRWGYYQNPLTSDLQFDLGLILLKEPVSGASTINLPRSEEHLLSLLEDSKLVGVGTGLFGSDSRSKRQLNERKRELKLSVAKIDKFRIFEASSLESKRGMCKGDSGGAIFARSEAGDFLLGVLSGITYGQDCGSKESRFFYSIITDHLCWVTNQVKGLTGSSLVSQCDSEESL